MVRSPGDRWKVVWHQTPPAVDIHFIIGFMGAGKSTLAKELSDRWNLPDYDTDHMIEKNTGLSIPGIFAQFGEFHFRKLETAWIENIPKDKPAIYACGGGMPCFGNNLARLKQIGTVWWLNTSFETIYERIKNDNNRPLASSKDKNMLRKLYENRLKFYRAAHAEICSF